MLCFVIRNSRVQVGYDKSYISHDIQVEVSLWLVGEMVVSVNFFTLIVKDSESGILFGEYGMEKLRNIKQPLD